MFSAAVGGQGPSAGGHRDASSAGEDPSADPAASSPSEDAVTAGITP